jgi:hypothetical protein
MRVVRVPSSVVVARTSRHRIDWTIRLRSACKHRAPGCLFSFVVDEGAGSGGSVGSNWSWRRSFRIAGGQTVDLEQL